MAITQMVNTPNENATLNDTIHHEAYCPADTMEQHSNSSNSIVSMESVRAFSPSFSWHTYIYNICFGQVNSYDRYDWTQEQQGIILGSFYIGYILTHAPTSFLIRKFGAKFIIGNAVLVSSLLSLLTPLVVKYCE